MEEKNSGYCTGMILGKFMPPHLGHQFLVDFGRHYVNELTVLVCSLSSEPIPGVLRFEWMKQMFPQPNVKIVHVTDDLPQEPSEHPRFWEIWHDVVRRFVAKGPDYVFASENYGFKLAEVLSAKYIPVDHARELVSVSGTAIRSDPIANWRFLPSCVRPHFVRKVVLFGPESTGKTTLAAQLARRYDTVWVGEYARPLLDHKDGVCHEEDIPFIARGQVAAEEAMTIQANRLLICDTDPLLTTIWSEVLFGRCPDSVMHIAQARKYDLYLLMDVDVPWIQDGQRYLPHARRDFYARCQQRLEQHSRPYVVIKGDYDQRFESACRAIDAIL